MNLPRERNSLTLSRRKKGDKFGLKLFDKLDLRNDRFLSEKQPHEPPQTTAPAATSKPFPGPGRTLFQRPKTEKRSYKPHAFLDSETATQTIVSSYVQT